VLCQLETRAVAVAVLLMVLLTKMQKVNTTRSCHLAAEAAGLATTMGSDKGQIAALCLVHHGAGLSNVCSCSRQQDLAVLAELETTPAAFGCRRRRLRHAALRHAGHLRCAVAAAAMSSCPEEKGSRGRESFGGGVLSAGRRGAVAVRVARRRAVAVVGGRGRAAAGRAAVPAAVRASVGVAACLPAQIAICASACGDISRRRTPASC